MSISDDRRNTRNRPHENDAERSIYNLLSQNPQKFTVEITITDHKWQPPLLNFGTASPSLHPKGKSLEEPLHLRLASKRKRWRWACTCCVPVEKKNLHARVSYSPRRELLAVGLVTYLPSTDEPIYCLTPVPWCKTSGGDSPAKPFSSSICVWFRLRRCTMEVERSLAAETQSAEEECSKKGGLRALPFIFCEFLF